MLIRPKKLNRFKNANNKLIELDQENHTDLLYNNSFSFIYTVLYFKEYSFKFQYLIQLLAVDVTSEENPFEVE